MAAMALGAVGVDVAAMALCATGVEAVAMALGGAGDSASVLVATTGWTLGFAGMGLRVSVTS